ncbi:hypothetical protein [Flavobacterium sp. N2820]|uniref:hypothetical protein n=1 Tax=Flavobacterium sp. N2820 TaxID=2986834 RepID=UPI0022246068|nr:hypothetical protein [Flavobacterium sp. N2820]
MDKVASNMQTYIIETSEKRLGKKLSSEIIEKIKKHGSYIGLEMIIDTVNSIEIEKLEHYLNDL